LENIHTDSRAHSSLSLGERDGVRVYTALGAAKTLALTLSQRERGQKRRGALLSYELVFIAPVVIALVLALVEFGLLFAAAHKVQLATASACRVATRPCPSLTVLDKAVRITADQALMDKRLVAAHTLKFQPGAHTGDPVVVEVRVPMSAASPDMLSIVGYSLRGRYLTSRVVMSKE
jgi:hypothetical protein